MQKINTQNKKIQTKATHSVRHTHYLYNLCYTNRINIHSYTPTHACMHIYTYTYIYTHIHIHIHIHIYIYIYIHTHTHIHIHPHN
jgi:hypothetical protein